MRVSKAIDYFLTALAHEQLSEHTIRAYKQDLNQFKTWTEDPLLDALSFESFATYFEEIATLKMTSVKRKRVVLHRFLEFCYRKKFCHERLSEYMDPIRSRKNTTPKEVLTQEEIEKIEQYLIDEEIASKQQIGTPYYDYLYYCAIRNRLIITFLLYTGARAHEVVSVKKRDIDFDKNTIILFTKGHKYNTIPIHEKLLDAFKHYELLTQTLESSLQKHLQESPYLFPSKDFSDTYMATRTLHDLMKKLSKVVSRPLHAHLFRHTFASYCIAAHMDISTISSLISHSNPSITLSIYTHEIDAHNKQEQIKKLSFGIHQE